MAAQAVVHAPAAALEQMRIECLEAGKCWHRHHEVPARIADQPFDLAFVIALAGPAKSILKQVVGLQLAEHTRALPIAVTQDAGHRDLGVVIEDRPRYPAKEGEGLHMPVA